MLSLQLKSGEYITIGEDIAVQIFEQSGSSFRVAVKAPRELPILRGEVHERAGNRPDGLLTRRPKSPSERRNNAKRFEKWCEKRELREDQRRRSEEERAAVVQELMEIANRLDDLISTHGSPVVQQRLKDLGTRLTANEGSGQED